MVAPAPSCPTRNPAIPADNPYQFTGRPLYYFKVTDGQEVEHELRLQDHRARWLDLLHGRWFQRDPGRAPTGEPTPGDVH